MHAITCFMLRYNPYSVAISCKPDTPAGADTEWCRQPRPAMGLPCYHEHIVFILFRHSGAMHKIDDQEGPVSLRRLVGHPGFLRLWVADGLSNFGTSIFTLSLQLLLIETMSADPLEVGWVRAAQWLPSLLFGLMAGVVVDRLRRRSLLIATDVASSCLLSTIAVLAMLGLLTPALLAVLVFLLGTAAVLQGGAHQSYTADLLPPHLLAAGNVKLSQTYTLAQTLGPLLGGIFVRLAGAPLAMLANAATYGASALLLLRVPNFASERSTERTSILADLREGIAWVYRHRVLAPYAFCLHVWFIGNSVAGTVYIFHASSLGLDAAAIGLTLACAGLAGLVGAALAERIARASGMGVAILSADFITGLAWFAAAIASSDIGVVGLCVVQLFYGFGLGMRGPLEMSLRNALTPSRLRGRMNTTIRSINWGLIAVAAPFGGWIALELGNNAALALAGTIMLASGLALLLSPFRLASIDTTR